MTFQPVPVRLGRAHRFVMGVQGPGPARPASGLRGTEGPGIELKESD